MIKALFWDNDGVLVNTEHLYFLATQQALEMYGIPLTKEQFLELFLIQGKGVWHILEEKSFSPEEIQLFRKRRSNIYSAMLSQEDFSIKGVEDVLRVLCRSYKMGIVTSSLQEHFEIIHKRTGFLKYFDYVVTAKDYLHSKPHPEPYLTAIKKSGFQKEECIAIEDSVRGLTSAREAGLRCIVIPNEFTKGSDFAGAYKVLNDISEVMDVLAELCPPPLSVAKK
ncbi:MAG: HAD family phosphatase [Syntrophorhabdaceae bacterium]|nr:HAD family phosphatase [Syntrophorhabdaceae bacterium]